MLKPGALLPDFQVPDQNGNPVSLHDFAGKKLIVYFYPEDNTPTCTKEACNLRDNYELLQNEGFTLVGVSPDSPEKHTKFANKFSLPFPLLADTEHLLIDAFGVWGEKKMYGNTYMGLYRTTFIADETGVITHVIDKVKSADHTNQILELVKLPTA